MKMITTSTMENILNRIQVIKSSGTASLPNSHGDYDCNHCKDTEFIIDGWVAKECVCRKQKMLYRRMKNAMIPDEFTDAELDNYEIKTGIQQSLLQTAVDYLERFDEIKQQPVNSMGFLAVMGESRIKKVHNPRERSKLAREHNSYGLGKTHLQVAVAKELIRRGTAVLIVSDVILMEDLVQARVNNDNRDEFDNLLNAVIHAPVLVWDDLGKSKDSDFNKRIYYRIINDRYQANRPIIFSTNEDMDSLEEKIDYAAASRLLGMAKDYLVEAEGEDYRVIKR